MRYQICVSGAASGKTVQTSHQLAYDLGRAVVKHGKTLITGATIGLPWYAAQGAFDVKGKRGISIGFSPASSFREHVVTYKLPTREFDYINFTGMAYVGRDIHLVRSSDAVITVGGRMGSLHELSTALESRKICGVLLGSGGLADFVPKLLKSIETSSNHDVIYDTDPNRLVDKVIEVLDERYADFEHSGYDDHINAKHRRSHKD
jgi:hypothetical protein